MKKTIRIYEIDDVPGYQWEINWSDADGEEYSEEAATDADLVERILDILMNPEACDP